MAEEFVYCAYLEDSVDFYALEVVRAHADGSYSRFAADPVEVAPAADSLRFEVTHDHAGRLSCLLARLIDNKQIMRTLDEKPLFCQPCRVIDFSVASPDLPDYKQLTYN